MEEISILKFSLKTPQGIDSLVNISASYIIADLITGREYIAPGHAALASVLNDYGIIIVKMKNTPLNNSLETVLFDINESTNEKSAKILFYFFENAALQISNEIDFETNLKYTNVLVAPYSNNFCNLSTIINKENFLDELKKKKDSLKNISQFINVKSGKKINFSLNKEKKMDYFIAKVAEIFDSSSYLKYL